MAEIPSDATVHESHFDISVGFEHSRRRLQRFNDTFISRTEGRTYIDTRPDVYSDGITASIGFDLGPGNSLMPHRWRIEGKLSDGDASHETLTLTDPQSMTATISLDGVYLEPGKFVPSEYTTTFSLTEKSGELHLLGEVATGNINGAQVSLHLGPMIGHRKQKVDIDYIAGLDYWLGPAFADRKAVHYIREELEVLEGGLTLDAAAKFDLTNSLTASLGLRASAYLQDVSFSGYDCLTGAFNVQADCDGRHHLSNNGGGTYASPISETEQMPGANFRLTGGMTQTIDLGHIQGTLHASGFIEAWLNDPAINNPTYDTPHPAGIQYGTTLGYGYTARASVKF